LNPFSSTVFSKTLTRADSGHQNFSGSVNQAIDAAHQLVVSSPTGNQAVGVFFTAKAGVFELSSLYEPSVTGTSVPSHPTPTRPFVFDNDYRDFNKMPIGAPSAVRVERSVGGHALLAVVGDTMISSFVNGKTGAVEQYRAHDPQPHWRVRTNDVPGNPVGV
jgi:hypothetical protein